MEEHFGLVHLCAKRFTARRDFGKEIEYDDLFQAGCVGLVKAAERFDPERGLQFSTYAVPVILGEIRALFRSGGALRVSRGLRELGKEALEAEAELLEQTGKKPTVQEIAEKTGERPERIAQALGALRAPLSLTDGETGEELLLPVDAPEERLTEHLTLRGELNALEERDKQLIIYRYFQRKTQVETAALLGMTQVQVSRREKKILAQLRGILLE